MAADSSIYSLIRPIQAQDPLEQAGRAMTLQNLMGQQELQGLQTQQARQGMADKQTVRDAYRRAGGDPVKLRAYLNEGGAYEAIQSLDKTQLEKDRFRAGIDKDKAETAIKQATLVRDTIAGISDDAQLNRFKEQVMRASGPDAVAGWPVTVNSPEFKPWQLGKAMNATALIERMKPDIKMEGDGQQKVPYNMNPNAGPIGPVAGAQPMQMKPPVPNPASDLLIPDASGNMVPNAPLVNVKTGLARAGAANVQTDVHNPPASKIFENENKLRDEYIVASKPFVGIRDAYNTINAALSGPITAVSTLAGATKFMKMIDPESVVRESELQMALKATGMLDRFMNLHNHVLNGNVLTPQQAKDIQGIAKTLYYAAEKQHAKTSKYYSDLSKDYGLEPARVVRDQSATSGKEAKPAPSKPVSGGIDLKKLSDAEIKRELGL